MSADSRVCALTTIWEARPFPTSRETQIVASGTSGSSTLLIWLDVFSNRRFEAKPFRLQTSTEQFRAVETHNQPHATIFDERRRKAVQEVRKHPC